MLANDNVVRSHWELSGCCHRIVTKLKRGGCNSSPSRDDSSESVTLAETRNRVSCPALGAYPGGDGFLLLGLPINPRKKAQVLVDLAISNRVEVRMPLPVTEIEVLREYLNGVMERANHHANEVQAIALALAGAIVWKKGTDRDIEVMTQDGDTKNVLWVFIQRQRYAFSFNHQGKSINMRKNTTRGPVLHSFSNKTPLSSLRAIFDALKE